MKRIILSIFMATQAFAMQEKETSSLWETLPTELKTLIITHVTSADTIEQAIANLKKAQANKQIQEIVNDQRNIKHIITLLSNNPKLKKSKIYIAAALDFPAALEWLKAEKLKNSEAVNSLILWLYWPKRISTKLDEIVRKNFLKIFQKSADEVPKQNPLLSAISDANQESVQAMLKFIGENLVPEEKANIMARRYLISGTVTNPLIIAISKQNINIIKSILDFVKHHLSQDKVKELFSTISQPVIERALANADPKVRENIINLLKKYGDI